jgi:hypothetical protein
MGLASGEASVGISWGHLVLLVAEDLQDHPWAFSMASRIDESVQLLEMRR